MGHRAILPVALLACAAAVTGCGIQDPYDNGKLVDSVPPKAAGPPAVAPGETDRDGPAPTAPAQLAATALAPTPQAAITHFARLYINWTAASLPNRARQLAAISIGQARVQALQIARRGSALVRYRVTNSGSVVAIARGEGTEHGRWAVITNELTSGVGPYLGLPATSHVTWVIVTQERGGYVVSTWYPAR